MGLGKAEERDGTGSLTNGKRNFFMTAPGDQMIIAIAFTQLADEGYIDPELRKFALKAIQNERVPNLLGKWIDQNHRKKRLNMMESVLMKSPGPSKATRPKTLSNTR